MPRLFHRLFHRRKDHTARRLAAVDSVVVIGLGRFGRSLAQELVSCGTEVLGIDADEGTVILQDLFVFRQDGYDENGKIRGAHQATGYIPKFFRKMQERGLPVDANVFAPGGSR